MTSPYRVVLEDNSDRVLNDLSAGSTDVVVEIVEELLLTAKAGDAITIFVKA